MSRGFGKRIGLRKEGLLFKSAGSERMYRARLIPPRTFLIYIDFKRGIGCGKTTY
jgi:hypothetical protein